MLNKPGLVLSYTGKTENIPNLKIDKINIKCYLKTEEFTMSNHLATVDNKTIKALFDEIEFYRKGLVNLRKKLLKVIPEEMLSYGSDLWWEKSDEEAIRSIKQGKGTVIRNRNELKKFLDV